MAEQKTPPEKTEQKERVAELEDRQLDQASGGMMRPPPPVKLAP